MLARRPRLLLVSPLPPPAGGVATWTQRILGSGLTERYDIRVLNTNTGRTTDQQQGVDGRKLRLAMRLAARYARILTTWRPDVVHINTSALFPLFALDSGFLLSARAAGCSTILHLRGSTLKHVVGTRAAALTGAVMRRAHAVFLLNEGELARARQLGVRRAHQVCNFVQYRDAPPRPRKEGAKLLYVGWIMREKGIFELIEALGGLPDVHVTMLGRFVHDSEPDIRAAVDRAGVADQIEFVGEVPLDEVWQHYDRANIFVLPSYIEGFPNTLLEAMIAALPVVATDVGAIPEAVVDGTTGLLVPARDAVALRGAIKKLSESEGLRRKMGQAGYQRALDCFEMERVVQDIADHYDRLLGRSTR